MLLSIVEEMEREVDDSGPNYWENGVQVSFLFQFFYSSSFWFKF